MLDIDQIEDLIANSEPLESFEVDDYADQDEISSALKEMLDRELC
jgi:DnaJ-domain-containing protein 1